MISSIAIRGRVVIPPGRLENWNELSIEPERFSWPAGFCEPCLAISIRSWLGLLPSLLHLREEESVELAWDSNCLKIQGRLQAENYRAVRVPLATLVRAAGVVGGRGNLSLVPFHPEEVAYVVEGTKGWNHTREMTEEERGFGSTQVANRYPGAHKMGTDPHFS